MNRKKPVGKARIIRDMLNGLIRPAKEHTTVGPLRTAEIIKMIRERNKSNPPEPLYDGSEDDFQDWRSMKVSSNAIGLWREIVEEIQFEDDPIAIKKYYKERLMDCLEFTDDATARYISAKIKGLEDHC